MNIFKRFRNFVVGCFYILEREVTRYKHERELNALIKDVHPSHRQIYALIIKNEQTYLTAQEQTHSKSAPNSSYPTRSKMLKVTKQVVDGLLALFNIVGVQPMSGPVGLIFTLQYRDTTDNRVSLDVISQAVEAGSRKFQTGWAIEPMQDMISLHCIDFDEELTKAVSAEIVHEITKEIFGDLVKLASQNPILEVKSTSGFAADYVQALNITLNKAANEIARNARRGCGNFIVTTPMGVALLGTEHAKAGYVFVPRQEDDPVKGDFSGLAYVGTLCNDLEPRTVAFKVYTCLGMFPDEGDDELYLVGYKGSSGEVDSGYFYCPYVPLMSPGIVVDPITFQPVVSLMTRYGKAVPKNASGYYQLVRGNLAQALSAPAVWSDLLLENSSQVDVTNNTEKSVDH